MWLESMEIEKYETLETIHKISNDLALRVNLYLFIGLVDQSYQIVIAQTR